MLVSLSSYQSLPLKPGIYLFLDQNDEVLYVGKAKNLKKRVSSYFTNLDKIGPKTKVLISKTKKIKTIALASEIEALLLEANCIKKYSPKYNTRLNDGKAYPLIQITVKDKYPKVLVARKTNDNKSIYFGPYPDSQDLRIALKTVRKIFPFQSVSHHPKRPCLYHHLGLCPCPEVFDDKEYKANIGYLIDFLKGRTKKVIRDLKIQRNKLSKFEEFEKAGVIQRKIDSIVAITNPIFNQFDYRIDPNLTQYLLKRQLDSLQEILWENGVHTKKLERIECYDISNISGLYATGSMVVFIRGEKDSSLYRRFKIKTVSSIPNDFAMMQEVLQRRMNHKEWPMPDLIVVDGGKGQVSAAMNAISAMKQFNNETINIPIIGLAKKEETIIIPKNDKTRSFVEISLPKDSPTLHLLMKFRDEAHRFAISYHRKLRSKKLLSDT